MLKLKITVSWSKAPSTRIRMFLKKGIFFIRFGFASTRIRIFFENASFLSVLDSRPHGDSICGHRKRSFSKTLSRVEGFKMPFSCSSVNGRRRVKMTLFENADVTASTFFPLATWFRGPVSYVSADPRTGQVKSAI